jgi:hypothetical protein
MPALPPRTAARPHRPGARRRDGAQADPRPVGGGGVAAEVHRRQPGGGEPVDRRGRRGEQVGQVGAEAPGTRPSTGRSDGVVWSRCARASAAANEAASSGPAAPRAAGQPTSTVARATRTSSSGETRRPSGGSRSGRTRSPPGGDVVLARHRRLPRSVRTPHRRAPGRHARRRAASAGPRSADPGPRGSAWSASSTRGGACSGARPCSAAPAARRSRPFARRAGRRRSAAAPPAPASRRTVLRGDATHRPRG